MTSEPVISGSISVLQVFKIFFPSLCIRLQQSDESEYKAQSQSNTYSTSVDMYLFKSLFKFSVVTINTITTRKLQSIKKREKMAWLIQKTWKKKWSFFYFRILRTRLTPLDLKDNQLARVYRGTVEDRVKRWVVSARVAVVIEASCFVVPDNRLIVIWFIDHICLKLINV